jgi:hypothetical protein
MCEIAAETIWVSMDNKIRNEIVEKLRKFGIM